MADEQKGLRMARLSQKPSDTSLSTDKLDAKRAKKKEEMKEYYIDQLAKLPVRHHDKVPIDFVGKGPNGYMLYDIV